MTSLLHKPATVFWVSVLILWLNFSGHILSTLPLGKYLDQEFFSERYVFSRLVYDLQHGTQAKGGFMLIDDHVTDLYKSVDMHDYEAYKQRLDAEDTPRYSLYLSHYGLQDDLIFPLWQGLEWVKNKVLEHARPGSRWDTRLRTVNYYYYNMISQSLIALINAVVISLIVLWSARQFSTRHAWLILGMILIAQPVLTFYGRSLWWMMWSWFLPFVLVLYSAYQNGSYQDKMKISTAAITAVAAGIAVCVRTLMGYEYVAPTMVSAMVPLVFYAIYRNWGVSHWFKVSFIIGAGCLIGALAGLYLHYQALQDYGVDPIETMKDRYEVRAYGGEAATTKGGEILKSTQASFFSVLGGYLIDPKELSLPEILFLSPFLWWLWGYLKKGGRGAYAPVQRRLYDALSAAIGVSFLGGVAMLVILKGHAYIHGYDIIIWSIPLNIFLLIFYAVRIIGLDKSPDER